MSKYLIGLIDRVILCLIAIWLYTIISEQPTVVYNDDPMQCKIHKVKPQTMVFIKCIGFDKELTKYLNSKEIE